mmetsp:Transcript_9343/g.16830  ORF Transcript_9343/g.16830 Transcript_9343/m.16830 type:complete len:114 (+) Transcript_9343:974-1315(+)
MVDPGVVASSRWREPCCWPKVWALRQAIRRQGVAAWGKDSGNGTGLGEVPIKWDAEAGAWIAGNRHRLAAALVAGVSFRASFKTTQVLSWGCEDCDEAGRAVKVPEKLWRAPI